jgi:hypothetical protein
MIIGLAGEKGCGKDTVAAYLVKNYEFERRAFADPLKRSVAALLGIPFHEVDKFKNDESVFVALGYQNEPPQMKQATATMLNGGIARCDYAGCKDPIILEDERHMHPELGAPNAMWSPIVEGQTFRQFLQRYGTESHRDVFGEDFWVDQTLPTDGYYPGRKIVVTDVRFDNEYNRIKELNGVVVRVYREGIEPGIDPHPSENYNFIADYNIFNNDGLDELWEAAETMIVWATEEEHAG